jgi:hypothetical protein
MGQPSLTTTAVATRLANPYAQLLASEAEQRGITVCEVVRGILVDALPRTVSVPRATRG